MKEVQKVKQQYKVTFTNKAGGLVSIWFRDVYEARAYRRELKKQGIIALVEYVKTEYFKPKITVKKVAI